MKYQVGDLLKCHCKDHGDAICVIVDRPKSKHFKDVFKVFWIIEKGYVRNTAAYQLWSTTVLDNEFVRLSCEA